MNDLSTRKSATLPTLIDRAASALTAAKDSAEVLEARELARAAYDAAKSAGRMAKAKKAHEEVMSAVYRAQADALLIEARAKMRLADEYDAAQDRGEVATGRDGPGAGVVDDNAKATAADVGIRRDEIHEARKLRDAEIADPGKAERALNDMVEKGEEPTKAKLRREMSDQPVETTPEPEESAERRRMRREFRRLTEEAQEDEFIGVREENLALKRQNRGLRQELEATKFDLREISESTDLGPAVSSLKKKLANARKATDDKHIQFVKEQRHAKKLKAEVASLKKKLEDQEITL